MNFNFYNPHNMNAFEIFLVTIAIIEGAIIIYLLTKVNQIERDSNELKAIANDLQKARNERLDRIEEILWELKTGEKLRRQGPGWGPG